MSQKEKRESKMRNSFLPKFVIPIYKTSPEDRNAICIGLQDVRTLEVFDFQNYRSGVQLSHKQIMQFQTHYIKILKTNGVV